MIAECYDLSVQCDSTSHVLPVRCSFNAMNRRDCWKQAAAAGWRLFKDGRSFCPRCTREKAKR